MRNFIKIGWKISTLSADIASIRYRALLPVIALNERGIHSVIFSESNLHKLNEIDVLVIVKSLTLGDLLLAQEAAEKGIPVIFDLCDNIFIKGYGAKSKYVPSDIFAHIARYLNAVVVTTEPLAQIIRHQTHNAIAVHVIPDGIETEHLLRQCQKIILSSRKTQDKFDLSRWLELKDKLIHKLLLIKSIAISQLVKKQARTQLKNLMNSIRKLKNNLRNIFNKLRFISLLKRACKSYKYGQNLLKRRRTPHNTAPHFAPPLPACPSEPSPPRFRMLWFGHHGASHASFGMLDILLVKDELESIALEFPCELVVVSNNKEKYLKHIDTMAIPTRYIEWSASAMESHIQAADVVIIPNSKDVFSICKSANRAVLALSNGTPVVATSTPALEALRECISLDNFAGELRKYQSDSEFAHTQVTRGHQLIENLYGQSVIGKAWLGVIKEVIQKPFTTKKQKPELIIVLNLIQDTDLALPVLNAARLKGLPTEIWFNSTLLMESARTRVLLSKLNENWRILPARPDSKRMKSLLQGAKYLLSVSESNLVPHRFTHKITRLANQCGIETATLQHGFESVGLTYSDEIHAIKKIRISSNRIYIWGPMETLHPGISPRIKAKCLPVGRPYLPCRQSLRLNSMFPEAKEVVAVFENLHWHRYADEFRTFFIEGLKLVAERFPEYIFLIKPHPAGLWSTKNSSRIAFDKTNIVIADPTESVWENHSIDEILSGGVLAAITTPSTIALEAASLNVQVAVIEHSMNCRNYMPLPRIKNLEDWVQFIERTNTKNGKDLHLKLNSEFSRRVLVPANSAELIIADLMDRAHTKAGSR